MCFWKKKPVTYDNMADSRFDQIMNLVRDLPPREYRKLKDAMDLCYQGYQKVSRVRGEEDDDINEIAEIEKQLEKTKK